MKLALDTNRYTDWVQGDRSIAEVIEEADAIFIPYVVIAELKIGFAGGNRTRRNLEALQSLLAEEDITVLYSDEAVVEQYVSMRLALKQKGRPIPENDVWIAAVTARHDLVLATRDAHFRHLGELITTI